MLVKVSDVDSNLEFYVNKSMVTHTVKIDEDKFGIFVLELDSPIIVSNLDHKKITG